LTGALVEEFQGVEGVSVYSPTGPQERSGIVTVVPPSSVDPTAAFEELTRKKIFISLRGGKLRFSPHFYNSLDEIRTAVAITKDVFRSLVA
jgi:cysteine desulfurase / selenocysteine lyase